MFWGRKKKPKKSIHDESDQIMKDMLARKRVVDPNYVPPSMEATEGDLPPGADMPKKEIDWDNFEEPPKKGKQKLSAEERAAQKVGPRQNKITSVSQLSWNNKQKDADSMLFGLAETQEEKKDTIHDLINKDQAEEKMFEEAVADEVREDEEEERQRQEELRRRKEIEEAEKARLAAEQAEVERLAAEVAAAEALALLYDPLMAEEDMMDHLFHSTGSSRAWRQCDGWDVDSDEKEELGGEMEGRLEGGHRDVGKWHGVKCGRRERPLRPSSPSQPRPARPRRGKVIRLELNSNGLRGKLPSFLEEMAAMMEAAEAAAAEAAEDAEAAKKSHKGGGGGAGKSSKSRPGMGASRPSSWSGGHPGLPPPTEWELAYEGEKMLDIGSGRLVPAPVGWARFTHLTMLSLSHNEIGGALPSDLSVVENLAVLNLSVNKFKGKIPPEWGRLTKLTHLWLFANSLTGPAIPAEIASVKGCAQLKSIRVQRNSLGGPLPNGLGSLTRLEELNLEHNDVGGELPDGLSQLVELRLLRVAHNKLRGPLPVHFFNEKEGGLPKLKDIRFYHNQFDEHTPGSGGVMRTVSNAKELEELS